MDATPTKPFQQNFDWCGHAIFQTKAPKQDRIKGIVQSPTTVETISETPQRCLPNVIKCGDTLVPFGNEVFFWLDLGDFEIIVDAQKVNDEIGKKNTSVDGTKKGGSP